MFLWGFYKSCNFFFLFEDHSSVSLSDLPINPPPPDVDSNIAKIDENAPLSEPPSPFLSREIYLECHRNGIEQVEMNFKSVTFFFNYDFFRL